MGNAHDGALHRHPVHQFRLETEHKIPSLTQKNLAAIRQGIESPIEVSTASLRLAGISVPCLKTSSWLIIQWSPPIFNKKIYISAAFGFL
jgi:hypothetical protein